MRNVLISLIGIYQKTLSPDHGPLRDLHPYGFCRHEPTCSEYGKRIIEERGMITGGFFLMKRLFSCHPWARLSDEKILAMIRSSSEEDEVS